MACGSVAYLYRFRLVSMTYLLYCVMFLRTFSEALRNIMEPQATIILEDYPIIAGQGLGIKDKSSASPSLGDYMASGA